MKTKKERVLVAMSGGVDSSVAAALLVKSGYEVTGAFMVNYDENNCWRGDYQDALRVAAKLNIPLLRLDFQKEYKKLVLDYMYREYKLGRTPNPDVLCNKFVKFGVWLEAIKKLGFDKLATGHYARVARNKEKGIRKKGNLQSLLLTPFSLLLSKDDNKDQTYFLNQLTQKQLKHILFPIGDYNKAEVRKLAKKFKLPTAEKEESMGICFVGEVPMKEFLQKKIKIKKGKIILSNGTIVGEHDGLPFYTIGQRNFGERGVTSKVIGQNKPLYIVDKDIKKNQLIVGYENDPLLYKKESVVTNLNWIRQKPKFPLKCEVRLRHRQPLQKCVVTHINKGGRKGMLIKFTQPQRAITPGQFAVFYSKGECLGGGVIK
jgi:tRNA-specific 2-thiouridylase